MNKEKRERLDLMFKIAERADEMDLLIFERVSFVMNLELADDKFNLRLEELLVADKFNFAHDIIGIQNHIDREEKEFKNHFLPRFSSNTNNMEE